MADSLLAVDRCVHLARQSLRNAEEGRWAQSETAGIGYCAFLQPVGHIRRCRVAKRELVQRFRRPDAIAYTTPEQRHSVAHHVADLTSQDL